MVYKERLNKRGFDEAREIEAKTGVIKKADGSAFFRIGNTVAYAAVYGPRELYPRFMQNPKEGLLRCKYSMMPFSGRGERVRPGPSRRSKEISLVTTRALLPVLNLEDFPNAVVDVFIELPQTEAGSRCAGICAASMALADAGIPMKGIVSAVSVGRVDDKVLADLDYSEESYEDGPVADIPIAIVHETGQFSLLQMDGFITKDMLTKAFEIGKKVCEKIYEVQKEAIKQRYMNGDGK